MTQSIRLLTLFLLTAFVATARADGPATAPAAANDETAVKQTFREYNDAMAKGDEATMISLQHAVTDDQKKFQKAIAQNDLAVGKLKAAVEGKFGADSAKLVARALGDVGNDDLERASVQVRGDRAMIAIDGGGIPMIKVDGKWLFDMSDSAVGGGDRAAQQLAMYAARVKNMTTVTEAVNAGKFAKVEEVLEELKSDKL